MDFSRQFTCFRGLLCLSYIWATNGAQQHSCGKMKVKVTSMDNLSCLVVLTCVATIHTHCHTSAPNKSARMSPCL